MPETGRAIYSIRPIETSIEIIPSVDAGRTGTFIHGLCALNLHRCLFSHFI